MGRSWLLADRALCLLPTHGLREHARQDEGFGEVGTRAGKGTVPDCGG